MPVSSQEFLDIQATIECIFTLKCIGNMIITQSQQIFCKQAYYLFLIPEQFYKSTQAVNEIWPLYVILQKIKILLKYSTKTATSKLVPSPFVFTKNWTQPLLENETFEALLKSDMYQQNYQSLPKLAHRCPQIPFYKGFFGD